MTKFKVGDTVRVKSLEWYNENKDEQGNVFYKGSFYDFMSHLCGKTLVINRFYDVGCDLAATTLGGIQYFLCEWMLEDEPIKTTASLSPPFNHPSDPSLTSQTATSIGHSSGLPFNATKAITSPSSKTIYPTEEHIYEAVDKADFLDWQQYRFDLIKAVLPALVQSDNSAEHCAKKSIEITDEVIKILKEEKNISDGI